MSKQTGIAVSLPDSGRWSDDQLKLVFHYYCQTPFGKLHSRNPEIVELAALIRRTPSAVAMKLVNFASLDPSITASGRKGLEGASRKDREIWDRFHGDWENLALECEYLMQRLIAEQSARQDDLKSDEPFFRNGDFTGESRRVLTEQRIKQNFFRKAVLSSYRKRCCMSGITEPKLLIASHIIPWSKDKANRLNPSNGLCLSAIHDKAFDEGLISLTNDLRIIISERLRRSKGSFIGQVFLSIEGKEIEKPERFAPRVDFVEYHRKHIFESD